MSEVPYIHPFNVGYQHRLDGKDEYDCPFPEADDYARSAWFHGWETADDDMEKADV